MDKAVHLQKEIKNNAEVLHSFMRDMRTWEEEMKRKESELTGVPREKDLPPVRSKALKKIKELVEKHPTKKILGSDYSAWDKFDADKACEEVDEVEDSFTSLDSKLSEVEKMEKLKEEAQEKKEKGNQFVKQQKWDDAIACYTRAIELCKDDPIYYANRGLCQLKKENLHAAEADCTKALDLDPSYVKALQRRACAREALGSLRRASADVKKIIELEPNNHTAKKQLITLTQKMGTKGPNSKMSPATTPTMEILPELPQSKVTLLTEEPVAKETITKEDTLQNKICEVDDVIYEPDHIQAIEKPPHLRSKKPLVHVPVMEIPLGCTEPSSKLGKSINSPVSTVPEVLRNGDCVSLHKDSKVGGAQEKVRKEVQKPFKKVDQAVDAVNISNLNLDEKEISYQIPKSSVQFHSQWKLLKGRDRAKSQYLKLIPPEDIPSIFQNFLDSDILSEILETLSKEDFGSIDVGSALSYLENIAKVKRFSALTMFLTSSDKAAITKVLQQSVDAGVCSQDIADQMKNKYEI